MTLWCNSIDYISEFDKLNTMAIELKNQTDIIDKVDSWTLEFERYTRDYNLMEFDQQQSLNRSVFNDVLTQFFFSPKGGRYRQQFIFEDELNCGEASSKMLLSKITFQHRIFSGPEEHIPAMNRVKQIIKNANLTEGQVFPLSVGYASWETDAVISIELYRNILLALGYTLSLKRLFLKKNNSYISKYIFIHNFIIFQLYICHNTSSLN